MLRLIIPLEPPSSEPSLILEKARVEGLKLGGTWNGLKVIAIGPRGGQIVGYTAKGKPIYAGSSSGLALARREGHVEKPTRKKTSTTNRKKVTTKEKTDDKKLVMGKKRTPTKKVEPKKVESKKPTKAAREAEGFMLGPVSSPRTLKYQDAWEKAAKAFKDAPRIETLNASRRAFETYWEYLDDRPNKWVLLDEVSGLSLNRIPNPEAKMREVERKLRNYFPLESDLRRGVRPDQLALYPEAYQLWTQLQALDKKIQGDGGQGYKPGPIQAPAQSHRQMAFATSFGSAARVGKPVVGAEVTPTPEQLREEGTSSKNLDFPAFAELEKFHQRYSDAKPSNLYSIRSQAVAPIFGAGFLTISGPDAAKLWKAETGTGDKFQKAHEANLKLARSGQTRVLSRLLGESFDGPLDLETLKTKAKEFVAKSEGSREKREVALMNEVLDKASQLNLEHIRGYSAFVSSWMNSPVGRKSKVNFPYDTQLDGIPFSEMKKRFQKALKEINAAMDVPGALSGEKATLKGLRDRIMRSVRDAKGKVVTSQEIRTAAAIAGQDELVDRLKPANPVGAQALKTRYALPKHGDPSKTFDDAYARGGSMAFLSRLLPTENAPQTHLYFGVTDRAFCTWDNNIALSNDDKPTVLLHEYGHAIEHDAPDGARASKALITERAKDESLRKLSDVTGYSAYADYEVTYEDEWKKPYTGKWYDGQTSTEVLAMGVQRLHEDPIGFIIDDADHALHTLAFVSGEYPKTKTSFRETDVSSMRRN